MSLIKTITSKTLISKAVFRVSITECGVNIRGNKWLLLQMSFLLVAMFTGCLGPAGVRITRPHYNESMQRTNEQELLLNVVRLRYDDSPLFLNVNAITAQFNGDSRAGFEAEVDDGRPHYFGTGDVGFADRPTISYAPQQGPDIAQMLLNPLSLESIALLAESKWNLDRLFRLAIVSFNGVDNAASAGGPIPESAPEFAEFQYVSRQLHELVQRRWINVVVKARPKKLTTLSNTAGPTVQDAVLAAKEGFGLESEGHQTSVVRSDRQLYLEINPKFVDQPEILELCQNLKLRPGLLEYQLSFASGGYFEVVNSPVGIDRLNLKTRSPSDIMHYLSTGVKVPDVHLADGEAVLTRDGTGCPFDWQEVTGDLFQVCACKRKPKAKLRIKYRGHWFYIADNDHASKRSLLLLANILALEQVESQQSAPLLAIPL